MSFEYLTLEDLAAPQKNAIVGGPFGSNLVSKDYVSRGVPVIRGANMGAKWVGGEFVFVSEEKALTLSQNLARPNDIVFTQRGTLGQVSIVPAHRYDRYIVSQSQMKVTVDDQKADVNFLYYLFNSPSQLEYIRNAAIQTGVPHTNLGILKKTPVCMPPLPVQKQIAGLLSALDDRIALLRETNATLEAIAQALFKSWFVDFDPVRAKQEGRVPEGMDEATVALFPDEFDVSPIGEVPRGWKASTLGSVCADSGGAIQTGPFGSQLHASDYIEQGIPVVMPQDMDGRRVQIEKIARVGDADANRLSRHQLRDGDIVFSRRGDVGRHALIGEREVGWLCGTGCLLVRPGKDWPSSIYLSLALNRADVKEWLLRHAVGATMPNLNTGILSNVPIICPDRRVLVAFDNVVRTIDERISHCHATLRTLADLRDTLLPRLISGQLRLPESTPEIENLAHAL